MTTTIVGWVLQVEISYWRCDDDLLRSKRCTDDVVFEISWEVDQI
jgi:hypothetical protein